ncbi:MAG: autotransporter outer membrane beta-barrel domain-containing protein [Dialister sp.]|nr:autotransporter outer membrane beta-barrel domain-containing protein [Dialister sp.]
MDYTDVPNDGMNWYARMMDKTITPSDNGKKHEAFARSRYGALWLEAETLRKRLGDLRENSDDEGGWARITRGEYKMDGLGGFAGYTMYQLGYDRELSAKPGQIRYAGIAFHHTDTDMNYTGFGKDSDMDSNIGTLYYTTLYDSGHYLDLVGKLGRVKGKLDTRGEFPETARWQSTFYSLSAEYGRKLAYENGWYLEPQAQLAYSHLGSDSYTSSQNTEGHLDAIDSLILRAGATLGRKQGNLDYYAKLFVHHEFAGDTGARFHDKNDDTLITSYDMGGIWLTAGIGAQLRLLKDFWLYGDIERSFGGDIQKKWEWNLGVRYAF